MAGLDNAVLLIDGREYDVVELMLSFSPLQGDERWATLSAKERPKRDSGDGDESPWKGATREIVRFTRELERFGEVMGGLTEVPTTAFVPNGRKKMLSELRAMNLDRIDMDDAVAAYAFGQSVVSTYESMTLEAPEWLVDKVESLKSYIETRRRENLERALKEIEAEENKLKTAAEKREELAARRKAIKSALGKE